MSREGTWRDAKGYEQILAALACQRNGPAMSDSEPQAELSDSRIDHKLIAVGSASCLPNE